MILTTSDLLARGLTHDEIQRRVRGKSLHRVARGRFSTDDPGPLTPEQRHRQLITAMIAGRDDAILSHASAGVLHGLWIPSRALQRVHLLREIDKDSIGRRIHLHPRGADPELTSMRLEHTPVTLTDLTTTTIALLRTLPLTEAIPVADSALRHRLDVEQAAERLEALRGWPGVRRARIALGFADARSESAGESLSRWLIHLAGLPAPVLQQEFRTESGRMIGRSDFWWPEFRLIGEFDGRVKYGRLLKPGQDVNEVVLAERSRELALLDLGNRMTRWTWPTLTTPNALATQLTRAIGHPPLAQYARPA